MNGFIPFRLTPKDLRANWAIKPRATWPQWRTHMRASIDMYASAKLKCVALHDCNYIMLPTAMIANALATLRCLCQPLRRADAHGAPQACITWLHDHGLHGNHLHDINCPLWQCAIIIGGNGFSSRHCRLRCSTRCRRHKVHQRRSWEENTQTSLLQQTSP